MRTLSCALILTALVALSACDDALSSAASDTQAQSLNLDPGTVVDPGVDDPWPGGDLYCTTTLPLCQMMCDPLTPYPGTQGACCADALRQSTCEEMRIYTGGPDRDGDGIIDRADNCPMHPNPLQENFDGDSRGDACDNCPSTFSADFSDHDADGIGNVCDDDDDNDGILDIHDLCPLLPKPTIPLTSALAHDSDFDQDGQGDLCDEDDDNDGIRDVDDNCDFAPNPLQSDYDLDGVGDACSTLNLTHVLLQRVRHKDPNNPGTLLTDADYIHWDNAGVNHDIQQNIYLTRVSDPPRDKVEHLVFITAGQQGFPLFSNQATDSGLTGQLATYKNNFPITQGSRNTPLSTNRSLLKALMDNIVPGAPRRITTGNTFVGAAFDAWFNYEHTGIAKVNLEEAYYRWLESQFLRQNLRSIFLAGHSRGGCLVSRLAQRFQQDYPEIPLIVQVYDGVCTHTANEFGVQDTFLFLNPQGQGPQWFAYSSDIGLQLAHPQGLPRLNLRMLNIVSGAPVLVPFLNFWIQVHGFTQFFDPATMQDPIPNSSDVVVWYERLWTAADHMGADDATPGIAHYDRVCAELGDVCNN